jgi:hypothetical protein
MITRESAVEFFKELVEGALVHQHIEVSDLTSYYLVQMLDGFIKRSEEHRTHLSEHLADDLRSTGSVRQYALRQIGDSTLFMAGFFSDSLARKLLGPDYYVSLGRRAYRTLSVTDHGLFSSVYAELADGFVDFVDVINEVSERCSCSRDADLLRLYEKWLKTGSRRSGMLLVERGVVPVVSSKLRPQ